jgi:hypothetical protein
VEGGVVEKGKSVICEICDKQIEVRWGIFAHETLTRHKKAEHK